MYNLSCIICSDDTYVHSFVQLTCKAYEEEILVCNGECRHDTGYRTTEV